MNSPGFQAGEQRIDLFIDAREIIEKATNRIASKDNHLSNSIDFGA
jgi:hypothetical protein